MSIQTCSCGCGTATAPAEVTTATDTCGCGCGSAQTTEKSREEEIAERQALRASVERRLTELGSK